MDSIKLAFVRKIRFLEGNDARMRTGYVDFVPAYEAVVDSKLVIENRTLMSYAHVVRVQSFTLSEKYLWFRGICEQLTIPWVDGHIKINVRRSAMLNDSMESIMGLSREDMRKQWYIEFMGEQDIDTREAAREWFTLFTEQIFDPDFGLWIPSTADQARYDINPASCKFFPRAFFCITASKNAIMFALSVIIMFCNHFR
jgi:hypothetical protein